MTQFLTDLPPPQGGGGGNLTGQSGCDMDNLPPPSLLPLAWARFRQTGASSFPPSRCIKVILGVREKLLVGSLAKIPMGDEMPSKEP